jgi:DNA (cytosine-5)-methyltransferase 1
VKKQIHIRLDQETLKSIKKKIKNSKQTLQDYIIKAIRSQEINAVREDVPAGEAAFKFIDLFAGIGGIRIAYENVGGKCVFSSEYDKYCQATYWANFHDIPHGDITKIDEKTIPDHDILTGGFPCQPFSIAGVSKKNALGRAHGFLDKTQGTLFFDIVRIINEKRPKAFMLENVKNLMSHDKGRTFKVIIETLENLEYKVYTKVLDGKYYVPQHRERTLIVGMDKKIYGNKDLFKFPEPPRTIKRFHTILEENVPEKYTLTDKLWNYLQKYAEKHRLKGNGFGFGMVDLNGVSRTLSARYYKDGSEILIPQRGKNPRRLTPRECARLQGFPDSFKILVSDCQAYRQFGNSVVRPLMEAVAGKLVEAMGIKEKVKKYA